MKQNSRLAAALGLLTVGLGACARATTPTPTLPPAPAASPVPTVVPAPAAAAARHPLISEVLAGVSGDNNLEFIELYNPTAAIADLRGWSLWYRLPTGEGDLPVMRWKAESLIPPHGHYLLGRAGEDIGPTPDAIFEQPLNTTGGGLELRRDDGARADALGWGKAPPGLVEGNAAPPLTNGQSLERAPGGEAGNGADSDDNRTDFSLSERPDPQNSGSAPAPRAGAWLEFNLVAPQAAEPGASFQYTLTVANRTPGALAGAAVRLPLPARLTLTSRPGGVTEQDGVARWEVGPLEAGASRSITLTVNTPWEYFTARASNAYAQAAGGELVAFSGPVLTRVEGGAMPIELARGLPGSQVVVQGVASMYTGGLFAGSANAKFYVQDDTAGLQVYVPGAINRLSVPLGARVRVRGQVQVYRGSMELVTAAPSDVEILSAEGNAPPPVAVPLAQALADPALVGRLVLVEGQVTRVEEFTYSFEIDLTGENGQALSLYVDKLTAINAELVEAGRQYRAVGILEVLDDRLLLYPRIQSDLAEVAPPTLLAALKAPASAPPGEAFTVTLTLSNHTGGDLRDVQAWLPLPPGATLEQALDGGEAAGGGVRWSLPELASGAGKAALRAILRAPRRPGALTLQDYGASAAGLPEAAGGSPLAVFVGDGVPLWAVQGPGTRTPYVLQTLTTQGVVTGVFPGLRGFWIQSAAPDGEPHTSEGLFVATGAAQVPVAPGDLVSVTGQVHESSGQTEIAVSGPGYVHTLSSGNALPAAVPLDPPPDPAESQAYFEALEGMLVQAPGPAPAVSPSNRYGEFSVVLAARGVERVLRGGPTGLLIMADDGASAVYDDRSQMPYAVFSGDQISDLFGPLAYTYGNFKIEPLRPPQITHVERPLPALAPTAADEFSLMTWNVENLFDNRAPNLSGSPMPTGSQYQLALAKVANTLVAAGLPTVVGLQEVENIQVLRDLAARPELAAYGYQPALIEGDDSRGIDVGFLVRGDRATIEDVQQHPAPEGLTSRPPLLVQVTAQTSGGPVSLYVIVNHFTSMSGGEAATEPRRVAQAAWNVTLLKGLLADRPGANVAILGDLNSFYLSPPLDTLRGAGLLHVFERLPASERYNYVYEGVSEALDHILVTPGLMKLLRRVEVLHVNADYPPPIPGDPSPERKSDHDPVVATFSLTP